MAHEPVEWEKIGLPSELSNKDSGLVSTKDALSGAEYIGLYFSAHAFTPKLSEFFTTNGARVKLQMIFVSSDRSETDFLNYFREMSWNYAISPTSPQKAALSRKYGVSGIPRLIIFDKSGQVVCNDGRSKVDADPAGVSFPWKPRGVIEALRAANKFIAKDGSSINADQLLAHKHIGLYFSAHWCPPCRGFTPKLASWYEAHAAAGKDLHGKLEMVFVSSDRSEDEFKAYLSEMPWKALPVSEKAIKAELSELFDVEGIPSLVFINNDGSIITKQGRSKVEGAPEEFPWPPKPRVSLEEALADINDIATLILFCDNVDDPAKEVEAVEALDAVAEAYFVDGKPHSKLAFALVGADDADAALQVRQFLGPSHRKDRNGPANARVTIVDIPNGTKVLFNDGKLGVPSKAELQAFVESFLDGKAATVPIKS